MSTETTESHQSSAATEAAPQAPPAQAEDESLRAEAAQTLKRHEEQANTGKNPALAELGVEAARLLEAQQAANNASSERAQELRSAATEAETAEKLEEAQPSALGALAQGALWGLGLLGAVVVVAKVVSALTRTEQSQAPRERGTEEAVCEEPTQGAPKACAPTPEPAT